MRVTGLKARGRVVVVMDMEAWGEVRKVAKLSTEPEGFLAELKRGVVRVGGRALQTERRFVVAETANEYELTRFFMDLYGIKRLPLVKRVEVNPEAVEEIVEEMKEFGDRILRSEEGEEEEGLVKGADVLNGMRWFLLGQTECGEGEAMIWPIFWEVGKVDEWWVELHGGEKVEWKKFPDVKDMPLVAQWMALEPEKFEWERDRAEKRREEKRVERDIAVLSGWIGEKRWRGVKRLVGV